MEVTFVPNLLKNPYQSLLAEGLKSQEVDVNAKSHPREAVIESLRTRAKPPGIIHIHWLPGFRPGVRSALGRLNYRMWIALAKLLKFRIVWTVHNLYSHEADSSGRRRERDLTNGILRFVDLLIVHSPSAKDLLLKEFPRASERKIAVIPHGNYIGVYPNTISGKEARGRFNLPEDGKVILFLGNIRPYKGVLKLVEVFKSLGMPKTYLLIAGKPIDDAAAEKVRTAIGDDASIRFYPGFVPDEDVQAYFAASDVVALPYLNIFTSGAAVLAMSFGKPCVAPRSGCLPDFFENQTELLYDPEDAAGLEKALRLALSNDDLIGRLGARNFEKANEWNWRNVAGMTAEAYRRALDRG